VPAEPDVAGAILTLNDTANLAQVTMSSFVPAPAAPSAGGGPVTMGISMKISGTFPQVFDYLVRLESLDRLVVVDSIQLTGSPVQNGPTRIDADIKARMFAAGTGTAAPAGTAVSTRTSPTTATTAPNPAAGPGTLAGGKPAGTAATAAALTKAGG
ncbi:MAG TPA: type 4a pilus biogenesis protein PilO, partial [Acidimicrobiia bacterium]|nr:type 4a pilus biogenesis protein PilO [Acidimicrobiia bacterium]